MVPTSTFRRSRHHLRAVEEEKEEGLYRGEADEIHSEGQQHVVDQRRGKSKKHKEKKVDLHGSRRKIQAKAKQLFHPPLRRFDKQLEDTMNKTTGTIMTRSAPPFPYDGEDFGGTPSRFICFLNPSAPSPSATPIHVGAGAAAAEATSQTKTTKSKPSSYYDFVKTLIEKNDFYSPECNVHRDVPRSQAK